MDAGYWMLDTGYFLTRFQCHIRVCIIAAVSWKRLHDAHSHLFPHTWLRTSHSIPLDRGCELFRPHYCILCVIQQTCRNVRPAITTPEISKAYASCRRPIQMGFYLWLAHHVVCISCHIGQDFLLEVLPFLVILAIMLEGSRGYFGRSRGL